ncbi:MAG TPA: glutamyl-tRNA reductase [Chloroflexota bacterium]
MEIIVVGVNHKAAPVAVREMLAFTPAQMDAALLSLHERIPECVLLSTCNRTEIYAVVPSAEEGQQQITSFLTGFHRFPSNHFVPFLFSLSGAEAVEHLFSVASGLESMILGEPQILGQVRSAFVTASARATAGPILSWVFIHALKIGKRVRTDTAISRNAVSISHAAVELAKKELGGLDGRSVLLIGAGDMGELAARNLVANGCKGLTVANRTYSRAAGLAELLGARAADLTQLPELLRETDIVISATGAPSFVLDKQQVQESMTRREGKPLFLVDIAVPRDIDPDAAQIEGVYVYDIDDLQEVCANNLDERQKAAAQARELIRAEIDEFETWWNSLDVVPTIKALRDRAEEIRQVELRKALSRMGELTDRERSTLEALTTGIVNKMLHLPTVRLKEGCKDNGGAVYAMALRDLFGLEERPVHSPVGAGE